MSTSNNDFINDLMVNILEGVHIPKVQVERELSPILGMFIESLLTKYFEDNNDFSGDYKLILPEFPLKKDNDNQSTNIDFLLFNKSKKAMVLLELKTDPSSHNEEQIKTYSLLKSKISTKSAKFLRDDLNAIIEGSTKKTKYQYVTERFDKSFEGVDLSAINNCFIIYLVPSAMKEGIDNKHGVDYVLTLESLPENIVHTHSNAWQVIAQNIQELDAMYKSSTINKDSISSIKDNIEDYLEKNPKLKPDYFQLGKIGNGGRPNYQVTFTNGSIQTFRFNGSHHHIPKFKNVNLTDKNVWNDNF